MNVRPKNLPQIDHRSVVRRSSGRRSRRHCLPLLVAACLVGVGGCMPPDITVEYGRQSGLTGGSSVNGTGVLAGMFRDAGHRVTTLRRISPRLRQFEVVVWAPDDFQPPSTEQRVALEDWLSRGGRTLIYVGRDFDAAPLYWERVLPLVPVDDRPEVLNRLAENRARHDVQRVDVMSDLATRWFRFERDRAPCQVIRFESAAGWLEGVETEELDIHLESRLIPPLPGEEIPVTTPVATNWPAPGSVLLEDELEFLDPEDAELQQRAPEFVEVLLSGNQEPLVTRLRDSAWSDSQLLVVANGSFLLNYPLLNRQHRKIAGRLIDACGEDRKVAFLETSSLNRSVSSGDDSNPRPTGLEAFTTWPLGFILMQAMLLGMVLCFVLFPIFGPPRTLEPAGLSDFGKHVEAFGRLLARTRDAEFARKLVLSHHAKLKPDRPAATEPTN